MPRQTGGDLCRVLGQTNLRRSWKGSLLPPSEAAWVLHNIEPQSRGSQQVSVCEVKNMLSVQLHIILAAQTISSVLP